MPDASPNPTEQPAPKVEGPVGNGAIGIGYAIGKLAGALAGDNGLRMLAIAAVGSVTWVATWSISRYTEQQTSTDSLLIRTGEERVERERAENARRERDMREWMTSESEKQRTNFSANVSFITKEYQAESERNRAMIFKLAGAGIKVPPGGEIIERPDK
jgi:hypothetical protein